MDVRFLQSFVTVVEYGSLAEAARHLDMSSAAVAARVRALEAELGTALLKRAGRAVKPTEAGLRILEQSRTLVRDVRDLRAMAGEGSALGEFRLGVFASAMTDILPPLLRRLYGRYPDINIFVAPGASVDLCRQVGSGALDAAIVVEPQFAVAKGCAWQSLLQEPLVVVAPVSLQGSDAHALLRRQPYIRYDRSVLGGQLADRYLRDHDIHPRQRLEVNSLLGVASLVGQELGVGLVPDWAPMWHSGLGICRVPLPERAPVRHVGLVWRDHGPRSSLAQALLQDAIALYGS